MKILLVEDEKQAALRLQSTLHKVDSSINIVGVCSSIKETLQWFKSHVTPDLMFLDIQLSDGVSFEIFKSLQIDCPIIFVTAFNNYALEAFKFFSLDYILKPYSQKDIQFALDKFQKLKNSQSPSINRKTFTELTKILVPQYKTRFFARINHTVYSIPISEIIYFTFEDNATILLRKDQKSFVINYSLDTLEEFLNPKQFFRINRKYIIQIDSIVKMNIISKSRIDVVLINNSKEMVSRSKSKNFRTWLDL